MLKVLLDLSSKQVLLTLILTRTLYTVGSTNASGFRWEGEGEASL